MNLEKVGETVDSLSMESPKTFLKDILSLICVSSSGLDAILNHFYRSKHLNSINGGYALVPSTAKSAKRILLFWVLLQIG